MFSRDSFASEQSHAHGFAMDTAVEEFRKTVGRQTSGGVHCGQPAGHRVVAMPPRQGTRFVIDDQLS